VANLVLGAQMLSEEQVDQLPADTVIYNLEQMARVPVDSIRPVMRKLAQRFPVWDYCEANLERWKSFVPVAEPCYVKIGWAPVLSQIPKPARQDIDVLLYGYPGDERLGLYRMLCDVGIRCVFVCGLYGEDRDSLIARSKLVVNSSHYTVSRIFEIARVSYLLANAKAVVTDLHPDTIIESDIARAVAISNMQTIVKDCLAYIDNDQRRSELERRGCEIFRARNIGEILRAPAQRLLG
jgi:hypothetical protein